MRQLGRKLFYLFFMLFLLSVFSFLAIHAAPNSFFAAGELNPNMTEEAIAQLKAVYGLDKPLLQQYLDWMVNLLTLIYPPKSLPLKIGQNGIERMIRMATDSNAGMLYSDYYELKSDYADILFSGAQPTSTDYSEQQAHRHYLQCLHEQCNAATRPSFRETTEGHSQLLDHAETVINELHRRGVRGQNRDFQNIIDVNRAALMALRDTRGFVLERLW